MIHNPPESIPEYLKNKQEAILARERQMAAELASCIIPRPPVSLWMILIPVIFVFYFWQLQRYSTGRKEFMAHWIRPRAACLEDACRRMAENPSSPPNEMQKRIPRNLDHLIPAGAVPDSALGPYEKWIHCLYEHYADLLAAAGSDHPSLVRSAYVRRGNYLLFINQLCEAECELNAALLRKSLKTDPEEEADPSRKQARNQARKQTARRMESALRDLRRMDADAVFS